MLIMILTLIYGMSSEAFDRLWNKLIIDLVGAPDMLGMGTTFFWGAINSVALLVTFGLTWLIRRKVDLDGKGAIARTLLTLTICLLVCLSLFGLSQTLIWASVAFLAVRAIRGAIAPLVVAWVNQRAEKGSRATLLSFEAQSHSFGEIMSGPTLGSIAQFVSIKAAMLASAAMLAPALALLGIRAKKAAEEEG
jgi:DHA3 family tetracycline resistance protein-like MFS transporter